MRSSVWFQTADQSTIFDIRNNIKIKVNAKYQILTSGIDFPLGIVIGDDDYFIANEKYEDANGITLYTNKLVLQSISKIEKADIKKKTLKDVWGE